MPDFREIPLDRIYPPSRVMREETVYEGLSELCESIAQNGLLEPIIVEQLPDNYYELIAGMRRLLAHKELGKATIRASIYPLGSIDKEEAMAHENLHRSDLNPVEEAQWYEHICAKHQISAAECARRMRVGSSRVTEMLALLTGDAMIKEAVRDGRINRAQARELNKIKDEPGRKSAL